MNVRILHLLEGARQARGIAVVIDVFRAFSTACYVLNNGAAQVLPTAEVEAARRLKEQAPEIVLVGERDCKMLPGFDYGNSPADIEHVDFSGKTVVHTTSAGTQGLIAACERMEQGLVQDVITGGFVNALAAAEYIKRTAGPETEVSLLALGTAGKERSLEDDAFAEYLRNLLLDIPNDFNHIQERLREIPSARKFFDPEQTWAPQRDFELCLSLNRFDFVLQAQADGPQGTIRLQRIDIIA